jgi:aminopeptidase N
MPRFNKIWKVFGFLILLPFSSQGQNYDTRSDSCDLLHMELYLDVLDFTNKTIQATAHVRFTPKVPGLQQVRFDLRNLTVSSVTLGVVPILFSQSGESVKCFLPAPLNPGDTAVLSLSYGGQPITGTGSFGGFYWSGAFAFNLGVSLNDIPHPFGRAWLPCFDNFVERFTLTCHVRVSQNHAAVCGGILTGVTDHGDGTRTFSWELAEPVPSYLMSVAVGPYVFLQGQYEAAPGQPVPYLLAARPQDTTNLKSSFVNLEHALQTFTQRYGPFVWSRVGYVLVPFTSGAMEHACNIAFPQLMANGSTTYQTTMAHELAHNWWGNNATCRTAADMWINEGLATYSEAIFLENLAGYGTYLSELQNNHKNVLEKAHIEDSTYHPLSPMPERFTYGYHTYLKGSTAMHNLRTYMGDGAFFSGLQAIQNQFHFKDIDAHDFRNSLENTTGQNLSDFFNDWIFQPGFPAFEIDSFSVHQMGSTWMVRLAITQKLRYAWHYWQQVPLRVTFRSGTLQVCQTTLYHSGPHQEHVVNGLPFQPETVVLNASSELLYAVTGTPAMLRTPGTIQYPYARLRLTVNSVTDSAWWHGAMYWVRPDSALSPQSGLIIIPSRFWRVDYTPVSALNADIQINYDGGNNTLSFEKGYITSEDSLVVLYRPDDRMPWQVWAHVTHQKGAPNDKVGSFTVRQVMPGYYCFGLKNGYTGIEKMESAALKIWPNPSADLFWIMMPASVQGRDVRLRLTDSAGRTVRDEKIVTHAIYTLSTENLAAGRYQVMLSHGRQRWTAVLIKQ